MGQPGAVRWDHVHHPGHQTDSSWFTQLNQVADNCVACRVTRDGTAYGWRNHAHKLGRDIWSDHFGADGRAREAVGLISSQQPQIIRRFAEPKHLRVGDVLQLHCVYDNTASDRPSGYGR